jgi:hypothetical protein
LKDVEFKYLKYIVRWLHLAPESVLDHHGPVVGSFAVPCLKESSPDVKFEPLAEFSAEKP